MTLERPADQDIIIVGGTGDLARRKLLPALYNLHLDGLLPTKGAIIGSARGEMDDTGFGALAEEAVREFSRRRISKAKWATFVERLHYAQATPHGIPDACAFCKQPRRLIYLSVPASAFVASIAAVAATPNMVEGTRLIVEKPFGHDLASSRALAEVIHGTFEESQVFRIDHYLGKEAVQNILVFRFGNAVFERIWNRDSIDQVQFTVAESIGVEGRGAFYEETGALRDILQNHVLQVLALLTMEAPGSLKPEAVRDEKAKLLNAMRPLSPGDVVRGQYAGSLIDGKQVPAYRDEEGVAAKSQTETFAAARLFIDNWRWGGVPFFLRSGKRLPRRTTEVAIVFREAPVHLFSGTGVDALKPNLLNISIQPEEAITLQFLAKEPIQEMSVRPVEMQFSYDATFKKGPAEAYERLIHDAMDGDHTLFARADSVDRAWEVVEPVLGALPPVETYRAGTWGPKGADDLIAPRLWHLR